MAAHAGLKNESMEDEKYHNLKRLLKLFDSQNQQESWSLLSTDIPRSQT